MDTDTDTAGGATRLQGEGRAGGLLAAFASAALFGAATPLAKELLEPVPTAVLAGLFYLGAALALAPLVLRRARSRPAAHDDPRGAPGGARRPAGRLRLPALPPDRANRLRLLGAVVFGGIVGPVLMLAGLRLSQAASVAMWLNLETTATALLAVWLFKEHLGRWAWAGNVGVLLAGLLLSAEGGRATSLGGVLVAGAALCWGLDNNLTALIDGITPTESTFWKGLVAGTTNLVLGLMVHEGDLGLASWPLALAVGALSYGVSIVLYISSAQRLGATRSQMIFASAPVFGVAGALLWLGEPFSAVQGVAAAILAVSLAVLLLEQHEHEHVHEALSHVHSHRHDDGHHDHEHPGLPASHRHSHAHAHERLVHRHPHWPDLHHRHGHGGRAGPEEA